MASGLWRRRLLAAFVFVAAFGFWLSAAPGGFWRLLAFGGFWFLAAFGFWRLLVAFSFLAVAFGFRLPLALGCFLGSGFQCFCN